MGPSTKKTAPITDFYDSSSPPTARRQVHHCRNMVEYNSPIQRQGWEFSFLQNQTFQTARRHKILAWEEHQACPNNNLRKKQERQLLPSDPNGIYLVLTSKDGVIEQFCMNSCGFHSSSITSTKSRVVYAHVGDPTVQCPGLCTWPYEIPAYGPPGQALVAANGIGSDGVIMNIATVLAGAATNPFKSGYFQGDVSAPLEAVTAYPGIFSAGAYPGYPGDLKSMASYNAYGVNGPKFLLPAMWDPVQINYKVVTWISAPRL
ncbi:hypothetical protein Acr_17g0001400 [Actinidia rufa]|uniref:EXORDIUM like 2 n=1 Tax=Actinidia rufa TaxID=165716 RepID=A0A7J0G1A8_9ERIC|nr:hypothetical protein Acr_17g0001400 [Actinidia rufa]